MHSAAWRRGCWLCGGNLAAAAPRVVVRVRLVPGCEGGAAGGGGGGGSSSSSRGVDPGALSVALLPDRYHEVMSATLQVPRPIALNPIPLLHA